MNWTDVVVLIIIGGNMLYGFNRGFITTIIGLVKWFAGIILAKMFYVTFTDYVIQNIYDPTTAIQEHVRQFIMNVLKIESGSGALNTPMTQEQIQMGIQQLKLPEFYSRGLAQVQGQTTYTGFVDGMAQQLTHLIVYVLGFLLLLLLIMMVLGLAEGLLNQLAKLPILKEFNKSGGLLVGAILGLITVYFVMILLNVFVPLKWSQEVITAIEQSQFAIYFYKYNVLQYFFISFFNNLYEAGFFKLS